MAQVIHYLSYTPVGFQNHITTYTQSALSCKFLIGNARHMGLMQSVIKEERFVRGNSIQEMLGLVQEESGHFVIFPQSCFAALHEAYTGNSVDNGVIVPMMPCHLEHFRVSQGCRFPFKIVLVIHLNRVGRVQSHHLPVLYIDRRNTVVGGSHHARIVKSYAVGTWFNGLVPVHMSLSHSQMPFPDGCRSISILLQCPGKSRLLFPYNERSITRKYLGIGVFPWIHTCKHAISAGGGSSRSGISVIETNTVASQRVYVGCADSGTSIGTDITFAEIVGYDKEDVGTYSFLAISGSWDNSR